MKNYYQILRLNPATDIRGKSEDEIKKKIENNYKALISRAPQMYPSIALREQKLKELEEARAILSNQNQRNKYDQRLKSEMASEKSKHVSIVVTCLTEESMAELMEEKK